MRAGVLSATTGPRGGFRLARPAEQKVEASGMMELMAEIERSVDLPPAAAAHLAVHRPAPLRYPAPAPAGPVSDYPQVRLAALPLLSVPDQARLLEDPAGLPLRTLRQALKDGRARATLARRAGGQLVAFGDDAGIAAALARHGVQVTGAVVPIGPDKDGEEPDSTDVGLIAETLARALGRTRGITEVLRSGQRHLLRARDEDPRRPDDTAALAGLRAAAGGPVTGHLAGPGGARLPWAEAVALAVEWRDGTWRLLFAPEIWVRPDFTDPPPGLSPAAAREAATSLGAASPAPGSPAGTTAPQGSCWPPGCGCSPRAAAARPARCTRSGCPRARAWTRPSPSAPDRWCPARWPARR